MMKKNIMQIAGKAAHDDGYEYNFLYTTYPLENGFWYTMTDNKGNNDSEFTSFKDVQAELSAILNALMTQDDITNLVVVYSNGKTEVLI